MRKVVEVMTHTEIQLSEYDDPLSIHMATLLYDLFEDDLRSLTPTDDEDMLFICFPCYLTCMIRICEERIEYLSDDFGFLSMEESSRTLESEKYPISKPSKYPIRSSRDRIRFMDIERDSK